LTNPTTAKHSTWAWALATWFGAGYLKPGPGTYGSVAAVILWFVAAHVFPSSNTTLAMATLIAAVIATLVGIPASTTVARESGRKDPGFVVIDEVAGQLFALVLSRPNWQHAVVALLFFRAFDITKPWPIRRLEALPEGMGIMLDDVAAGIAALAATTLVFHFL
jgi:phosphatidylglycerophosphatase A